MRKYELLFVVRPNMEEEARKAIIEEFKGILTTNGAEITLENDWGIRDFATEINKFNNGHYYLVEFTSDNSKATDEFERLARYSEDILRNMIVNITDVKPNPEPKKVERKPRREENTRSERPRREASETSKTAATPKAEAKTAE